MRNEIRLRWRSRRRYLVPLLAAVWIGGAGCRSTPEPVVVDVAGPGWRVQQGQAVWRPSRGGAEFTGDLLVSRNADHQFVVHFSKPMLPLVTAQGSDRGWRLEFVPQHRAVSGRDLARARSVWLMLPLALDGGSLPADWRFETATDGGWRLANQRTGEVLEGFLEP